MIGLDANILVRYIAQDDPVQSPKATALIEDISGDKSGFISLVAMVQLVRVMGKMLRRNKSRSYCNPR